MLAHVVQYLEDPALAARELDLPLLLADAVHDVQLIVLLSQSVVWWWRCQLGMAAAGTGITATPSFHPPLGTFVLLSSTSIWCTIDLHTAGTHASVVQTSVEKKSTTCTRDIEGERTRRTAARRLQLLACALELRVASGREAL